MIMLTLYNSSKHVYIDEKRIVKVTDGHDLVGNRSFPWSNVVIFNDDGSEETIVVTESARNIGKLISEAIKKRGQTPNG